MNLEKQYTMKTGDIFRFKKCKKKTKEINKYIISFLVCYTFFLLGQAFTNVAYSVGEFFDLSMSKTSQEGKNEMDYKDSTSETIMIILKQRKKLLSGLLSREPMSIKQD